MSWHFIDKGGKWLIRHHGDSLLRASGVTDIVSWRAAPSELVQPGQLSDGLLEVYLAGRRDPAYFLLELATKAERRLTRQMIRDMMLVHLNYGVWPEALAIVLRQTGRYRVPPGMVLQGPAGLSRCELLAWRVVELWTLPADPLLAANDVGIIPWVPLMNFRGSPETLVRECRRKIDRLARENERTEILALTQVMTNLRFNDQALLALLGGDRIMSESSLIDLLMEKRIAETKQEDILRVLRTRFGSIPRDMVKGLKGVFERDRLNALLGLAANCPDLGDFRKQLPS